jgi:hypothetical protein
MESDSRTPKPDDEQPRKKLPSDESEDDEDEEGHLIEEHLDEDHPGSSGKRRHRKRIKIRKRVRIKRKTSGKKKVRNLMTTIIWIIIVAAFIITLVMLSLQLDLSSKHKKSRSELMQKTGEKSYSLSHFS